MAECAESHSLGESHEGIADLEEAAAIYEGINPGRINGIPSIGIKIHADGAAGAEDIQLDILSGREIDSGMLMMVPGGCIRTDVQGIIKKLAAMFPDKEVVDL